MNKRIYFYVCLLTSLGLNAEILDRYANLATNATNATVSNTMNGAVGIVGNTMDAVNPAGITANERNGGYNLRRRKYSRRAVNDTRPVGYNTANFSDPLLYNEANNVDPDVIKPYYGPNEVTIQPYPYKGRMRNDGKMSIMPYYEEENVETGLMPYGPGQRPAREMPYEQSFDSVNLTLSPYQTQGPTPTLSGEWKNGYSSHSYIK